jgi:predicted transcriptional regulator
MKLSEKIKDAGGFRAYGRKSGVPYSTVWKVINGHGWAHPDNIDRLVSASEGDVTHEEIRLENLANRGKNRETQPAAGEGGET